MQVSTFVLYFVAELLLVLLIICGFLLFHVRGLKNLITALEAKVTSLRVMIKRTRGEARLAVANLEKVRQQKPKGYLEFLDEQIERTRAHHEELNPDRDIVLDIDPDSPPERQAASLRHAFLIAEQEAIYAGGDDHHADWGVLEAKFGQLIQFYKDNLAAELPTEAVDVEDTTEVDQLRKRIEHLEEFKKLYFELEKKWESISDNADGYHQQLLAMGQSMGAGEDFEQLLDSYAKNFHDFGLSLGEAGQSGGYQRPQYDAVEIDPNKPSVGKIVIANQEEIQRLKNMAVDQHKVIQELKRKLASASTLEQKDEVIQELHKQMERQERFLKESETCARLMEDEMNRMTEENELLRAELEQGAGANPEEIERLENIIADLTDASQEMLGAISTLEQENRELKAGGGAGSAVSSAEVDGLKAKLSQAQQNLLDLQAQHLELEERYLDLKRKQK